VTALARPRSNCTSTFQTHPLVREGAPYQEMRNYQTEKEYLVVGSIWEPGTKTDWLTDGRKLTSTSSSGCRRCEEQIGILLPPLRSNNLLLEDDDCSCVIHRVRKVLCQSFGTDSRLTARNCCCSIYASIGYLWIFMNLEICVSEEMYTARTALLLQIVSISSGLNFRTLLQEAFVIPFYLMAKAKKNVNKQVLLV
jgi:hypothetical protein